MRSTDYIYNQLREELKYYSAGRRFYSIREIMRRYRCSQRVVERVLGVLAEEKLLRREPNVGFFSCIPHPLVRHRLLLMLPDWPSYYLRGWCRQLDESARKLNWSLQTKYYDAEKNDFLNTGVEHVDALLFIGPASNWNWALLNWLEECSRSTHVVILDNTVGNLPLNNVAVTDEFSGYLAVSHLYENGHRNLMIVCSEPENSTTRRRHQGARNFLVQHPEVSLRFLECHTQSGELAVRKSYECMLQYLERNGLDFSAVYVDSMDSTPGALKALAEHGFSVPEDVSVICNDILSEDAFPLLSLTTVGVRQEVMAKAAINGLGTLFNGSAQFFHTEICAEIKERDSVRNLALSTRPSKPDKKNLLIHNLPFDFQKK